MRNPGENADGRLRGRRRGPSGRSASPRPGPAKATSASRAGGPGSTSGEPGTSVTVGSEASLFTPGYSGGQAARRDEGLASPWAGGAARPYGASYGTGAYGTGAHGAGAHGAGTYGAGTYGTGAHGTGTYGTGPYGPPGSAAGKGPIRGFPPVPGQPPPLYPPGQFSAWNRAPWPESNGYADPETAGPETAGPDSGAWPVADPGGPGAADAVYGLTQPGYPDPGYIEADYADAEYPDGRYADEGHAGAGYADPDYSALAVSDPAADVTSTQSWRIADADPAATSGWSDLNAAGERGRRADPYSGHSPAAADYGPDLAPPDEALTGPGPGLAAHGPGPGLAAHGPGPGLAAHGPAGPALTGLGLGPGGPALAGPGPGLAGSDAAPGPAGQRWDQDNRAEGHGRGAAGPNAPAPVREPARRQGARGHGARGRARPRARKRRGRVLLAVGLAIAVAAAGYVWFAGRSHARPPAAATHRAPPRPSASEPSPSPSASLGVWGHITSRALDPVPLTLAELFPAQFANGGARYTRTVQKARARCSGALIGSTLSAAVSHAGCTQVMRASYLSSGNKLMGTIGVLNLATAAAAEKAGRAAGPAEFIAQLPAATGPTKRLTHGTGLEAAEVKGHYLVLVWAELTDLRPPRSAAQRRELEAFISVLIQKTANVSLAIRMVTGRPAT